jgi:hypothetical protein
LDLLLGVAQLLFRKSMSKINEKPFENEGRKYT